MSFYRIYSIISILISIIRLSNRFRYVLVIIFLGMFASLVEMLCVTIIVPVFSEILEGGNYNPFLTSILPNHFITLESLIFIIMVSLILRLAYLTFQIKTVKKLEGILFKELISKIRRMGYHYIASKGDEYFIYLLLTEIPLISAHGFGGLFSLSLSVMTTIFISIGLFIIDPKTFVMSCGALLIYYLFVAKFVSRLISRLANERLKFNENRVFFVSQFFKNFEYILINRDDQFFIDNASQWNSKFTLNAARVAIASILPRFGAEGLVIIGLLSFISFSQGSNSNLSSLAILSAYAFAAYRLIPAIQNIFQAVVQFKNIEPVLVSTHRICGSRETDGGGGGVMPMLEYEGSISTLRFVDCGFDKGRFAIRRMDLEIGHGEKIAIIGPSGSGKSSFLSVLLGTLRLASGRVEINGKSILATEFAGVDMPLAYVPQEIALIPGSIRQNVAFPEGGSETDNLAIESVLDMVGLSNWARSFPDGIDQNLGVRAQDLSGGQKQRLGIARALYQRPKFLILDEATCSLDKETGDEIIKKLIALEDMTIVFVTHDERQASFADQVFDFSQFEKVVTHD